MKFTLKNACAVLANLQHRASHCLVELRNATTFLHAAEDLHANGRVPGNDAAEAREGVRDWQVAADETGAELRAAAGDFASFVRLFPAANDEGFEHLGVVAPMTDKASILCKLLAHGGLGVGEILEITRWTRDEIDDAIATAIGDSRIVRIKELNMQPVYRLSSPHFWPE